jgi:hypothetical protein
VTPRRGRFGDVVQNGLASERVEAVTKVPKPIEREADPAAVLIVQDAADLSGVEVLSMRTLSTM